MVKETPAIQVAPEPIFKDGEISLDQAITLVNRRITELSKMARSNTHPKQHVLGMISLARNRLRMLRVVQEAKKKWPELNPNFVLPKPGDPGPLIPIHDSDGPAKDGS